MSAKLLIPRVPADCAICGHELRFAIQKDIDMGLDILQIQKKYDIKMEHVNKHIVKLHRAALISFGQADYEVRKAGIDIGKNLASFIDKWMTKVQVQNPDSIKDADAIRAMELYLKSRGELTDKHEVTVKKSIEEALSSFLGEEESTDILEKKTEK